MERLHSKRLTFSDHARNLPAAGWITVTLARLFGKPFVGVDVAPDGVTRTTIHNWRGRSYVTKIERQPPPGPSGHKATFIAHDENMSTELNPTMRRSALIAALRDQSLWPAGFGWEFAQCRSCGIGLLTQMMEHREAEASYKEWENIEQKLGLTHEQAIHIFGKRYNMPDLAVTPGMVADRLEAAHKQLSQ